MEISTAKIWKYGNEARQDAIFPFPFLEIWKSAFWKLENGNLEIWKWKLAFETEKSP